MYGNAFAAAIDRQKTLIRRTRNELGAGATFSSAAIFSALAVPVTSEIITMKHSDSHLAKQDATKLPS